MSVEAAEARILAGQMNTSLTGRPVSGVELKDYEKIQRIGFINKNLADYDRLIGRKVEGAESRGNTIRIRFNRGMNLLIGPEYGGLVLLNPPGVLNSSFHLKIRFIDGYSLTVRLTSMGIVNALTDAELNGSYLYKRDYSGAPSPLDEGFTLDEFQTLIRRKSMQLKAALVGKDAVVVGVSNSGFQDSLYRAGIHPKGRTGELTDDKMALLHSALKQLMADRLRLGGKEEFTDLHGVKGQYAPKMGPNMKNRNCLHCGTPVESLALGGGVVYLCPSCQK